MKIISESFHHELKAWPFVEALKIIEKFGGLKNFSPWPGKNAFVSGHAVGFCTAHKNECPWGGGLYCKILAAAAYMFDQNLTKLTFIHSVI